MKLEFFNADAHLEVQGAVTAAEADDKKPKPMRLLGEAIRYMEWAVPYKGLKFRLRFAPGAFGDVSSADVILNRQHDRTVPLARTGGGGLTVWEEDGGVRFESSILDSIPAAKETVALVQNRILRGSSVEVFGIKSKNIDSEETDDGWYQETIKEATLQGIGVVDRPAYRRGTVSAKKMAELALAEDDDESVDVLALYARWAEAKAKTAAERAEAERVAELAETARRNEQAQKDRERLARLQAA